MSTEYSMCNPIGVFCRNKTIDLPLYITSIWCEDTNMIEYASSPMPLSQWNPAEKPFYLEIFGETSPVLDAASAEVVPAGKTDEVPTSSAPVYEYWWTLGHPGAAPHHKRLADIMPQSNPSAVPIWERLQDIAARVYLYFPVSFGWRVREIMATVKYLTPVHQQESWWTQAGNELKLLEPLIGDAGNIAKLVPGGTTASNWLTTISKLQPSSVPPSKDFPWSVEKVTHGGNGREVMQGVVWNLPKSLLEAQGGRLTGSLAVSVIPAREQAEEQRDDQEQPDGQVVKAGPAQAHAEVYPKDGETIFLPGPEGWKFIQLLITPKDSGKKLWDDRLAVSSSEFSRPVRISDFRLGGSFRVARSCMSGRTRILRLFAPDRIRGSQLGCWIGQDMTA